VSAPSDPELRAGLERALAGVGLELSGEIERRPSPYRTSFPIEELRVDLVGRGEARLGFKQLDWDRLEPGAQLAKPRFLHDPEREPEVYRLLLPQTPSGPPEFLGSVLEDGRRWLFVEWSRDASCSRWGRGSSGKRRRAGWRGFTSRWRRSGTGTFARLA